MTCLITLGTINNGKTPIIADCTLLRGDIPAVDVLLATDYYVAGPTDFPIRPYFQTGTREWTPQTIAAGTIFRCLKNESDALVAAGAGTVV